MLMDKLPDEQAYELPTNRRTNYKFIQIYKLQIRMVVAVWYVFKQ